MMKLYRITYMLQPDDENITFVINARTYEEACVFAKDYRKDAFIVEEM